MYTWLYFSAFAIAWFLVGFMTPLYVSTNMKRHVAGIMDRLRLADMEDGTDTTEDSNSNYPLGNPWVDWDFPVMPQSVSKFIGPILSTKEMEIHLQLGPTPQSLAV